MNNLLLTKERINKAARLNATKLAATKNGKHISYRPSVLEERQKQAREEDAAMDS